MCGIIGCVGRGDNTLETLLHGLEKLEYRGYDSAGVALGDGSTLQVRKCAGEIQALKDDLQGATISGTLGLGHSRWSTHGPPTDANAHPHVDCRGDVAVVHNGIIENYQTLRDELLAAGHEFSSDTDTEVVPHLIEDQLADGHDPETAFRNAIEDVEGSYAIAAVIAGSEAIFAARNDSPLVLGLADGATFLASDVPAFRDFTDSVVYVGDGEFVRLDGDGWTVTDADGSTVDKSVETVEWDAEETGKSGYDHFMLKEIHEQPRAIRRCIRGRVDELRGSVDVGDLGDLSPTGVHFVAAGTSYHAGMFGERLFQAAGVPAQSFIASEYASSPPPIGDALVIGVSQSGETADTLAGLREADRRGARTLAVTNVVGSTAEREADHVLHVRAGPEIGVAATKTFATQLAALTLLQVAIAGASDTRDIVTALRELPANVQSLLDESRAQIVAETYADANAFFFIGRGYHYPVALEGALKMKEITYRHAEGFAAGELKHGPLALVTEHTPVFAVVTGDDALSTKTVGNV
ncbi:MAG: glutamine--fructose-6-phosphate transaminase (isomerizing), partial [Salinirussus sp.]